MIVDYQRVLENAEQQINVVLAQKMTYRAAMASLDESRLSIEHSKRSIEQNDRVKKLTQLAFIFIPLSFSTSAFGMNLEVLGTGKANVWMVVVAIVLVYFSTGLLWMLLHYQDTIAKITAATSQMRPVRDVFNFLAVRNQECPPSDDLLGSQSNGMTPPSPPLSCFTRQQAIDCSRLPPVLENFSV